MAPLRNGPCACGECGVFKKTKSTNNSTEQNIRNNNGLIGFSIKPNAHLSTCYVEVNLVW